MDFLGNLFKKKQSEPAAGSRYWKCPNCGKILDKGEGYATKAGMYSSPLTETAGTVSCGNCHYSVDMRDVYSGKYDTSKQPIVEKPTAKPSISGGNKLQTVCVFVHDSLDKSVFDEVVGALCQDALSQSPQPNIKGYPVKDANWQNIEQFAWGFLLSSGLVKANPDEMTERVRFQDGKVYGKPIFVVRVYE